MRNDFLHTHVTNLTKRYFLTDNQANPNTSTAPLKQTEEMKNSKAKTESEAEHICLAKET